MPEAPVRSGRLGPRGARERSGEGGLGPPVRGNQRGTSLRWSATQEGSAMTIGAALAVIIVGVLIAALANSTIGLIVAAIGIVGLILALVSGRRAAL